MSLQTMRINKSSFTYPSRIAACALVSALTLGGVSFAAETDPQPTANNYTMFSDRAVRTVTWPNSSSSSQIVYAPVNTSQVLRFDRPIVRVAVSNPLICDVTTIGDRDLLINSIKAGNANLLIWDSQNQIATYALQSVLDVPRLEKVLHTIDPDSEIQVVPFNGTVSVYGTTDTSVKLKQMADAIKSFDEKALNFTKMKGSKQVLLEVRFAEVNERANFDFKLDFLAINRSTPFSSFTGQTGASATDNETSYTTTSGYQYEGFPSVLGTEAIGNIFVPYVSRSFLFSNYLKFLESKSILKVIARPNLLAKDGEEAEFRVGGEFPIPTANDGNTITITYKQYGTRLKFTPEILDNGIIRLKLDTEVSEIDFATNVTAGGVSVPGLTQRVQKTVVELKEDQTLVIAGLMNQKITKSNRRVPGLGKVPVIGKPFNADEYIRSDVELMVIITPHVVEPMNLQEGKIFYDPPTVKDAIRPMAYDTFDKQGQQISKLLVQQEQPREFRGFDEPTKTEVNQFATSVAKKMESRSVRVRTEDLPTGSETSTNFGPRTTH